MQKIKQKTSLASIGLVNPKSAENVGSILRAAGCFGVSSVFYTGQRYGYAKTFRTDTRNTADKIPTIGIDDLRNARPVGARAVAIELVEGATPLHEYQHPQNGFYIFGPEDGSLKADVLEWCDDVVYLPTNGSLNLAATANIVLYDRMIKQGNVQVGDTLIRNSRDNNNRARV